jgi:hypothetical protein
VRLPAEAGFRLLLQHDHVLSRLHEFGGRDEARESCTDDDHVGVLGHRSSWS